jgi:hypothetical protein
MKSLLTLELVGGPQDGLQLEVEDAEFWSEKGMAFEIGECGWYQPKRVGKDGTIYLEYLGREPK